MFQHLRCHCLTSAFWPFFLEAVKRVFEWLQFETVEHMDLEAKQIYEKVKTYSEKDHSNMDCFACFIFSHGEKDKIKGVDDQFVNIKDLVSCFSGSNCPSLAGKPKLFFIQACQGSVDHPPVTVKEDFYGHLEMDATPLISIPDEADILVGMATVEHYKCYRCTNTGSIYIQCLCEKMKLLCPQWVLFLIHMHMGCCRHTFIRVLCWNSSVLHLCYIMLFTCSNCSGTRHRYSSRDEAKHKWIPLVRLWKSPGCNAGTLPIDKCVYVCACVLIFFWLRNDFSSSETWQEANLLNDYTDKKKKISVL